MSRSSFQPRASSWTATRRTSGFSSEAALFKSARCLGPFSSRRQVPPRQPGRLRILIGSGAPLEICEVSGSFFQPRGRSCTATWRTSGFSSEAARRLESARCMGPLSTRGPVPVRQPGAPPDSHRKRRAACDAPRCLGPLSSRGPVRARQPGAPPDSNRKRHAAWGLSGVWVLFPAADQFLQAAPRTSGLLSEKARCLSHVKMSGSSFQPQASSCTAAWRTSELFWKESLC